MSINDLFEKIKPFYVDTKDRVYSPERGLKIGADLVIVLIIALVGTASFGLGKLSAIEKKKTPIVVYKTDQALLSAVLRNSTMTTEGEGGASSDSRAAQSSAVATLAASKGLVFSSKTGKKYYYPWCSGADRIKEVNKVWFGTIEQARAAGLTPISGCTGLK